MTTGNDPAFPGVEMRANQLGVQYPVHHPGMTLRQWYAGQAMAALLASDPDGSRHIHYTAQMAFYQADAMIAAENAETSHE